MSTIAFDVDFTLINEDNTPNYRVIDLYRWFQANGERMVVWSGGGASYAQIWADKLGLDPDMVVRKSIETAKELGVDLAVDDEWVELGKVNIKISRIGK